MVKVIVPYKSKKYSIERALMLSQVEFDEIVYVFERWLDCSWSEMKETVKEKLKGVENEDYVYFVGAGYIPAVLSIYDYLKERGIKIILLDYDTKVGVYRRRVIK